MKNKEKSSNIPNLRFPEFSDEWKSFILKDIVNMLPTNSLSWDDLNYDNKNIKNIHYGLLHKKNKSIMFSSDNDIPYINEDIDTNKFNFLISGDFILVDTSENRCDLGKSVEVIIDDNNQIVSGLHTFHLRDISNLFFIGFKSYLFQTENIKKQLYKIAIGSKIFSITKKDLLNIKITIPSINEQKKIVTTLKLIDNLIETQSKIIEDYKKLTSLISNLLFSNLKNCDLVELKSICNIVKGEQLNNSELEEFGNYYLMNGGVKPSGFLNMYNRNENTISISEGGSCGFVAYHTKKFWCGGHCYTLDKISKKFNQKFLFYYLKNKENQIEKLKVGSSLPNIQKKDLEKFKVFLAPINVQNNISQKLDIFTENIKINEKELYKVQELKAYLLKNLFT